MSNDSATFVVLGDNYWNKGDYLYEVIENWLKQVGYDPRAKQLLVLRIDAKPDQVSVDGMGGVHFPEGAECQEERLSLEKAPVASWLRKARRSLGDLDEAQFEVLDEIHSQSKLDTD